MENGSVPHMTVIIATRNRAQLLRGALESMTHLDLEGISAEIVVVDNDSSDDTKGVIESFRGRLPVRYLLERQPGQNHARNRALREVELGRLVVFTDDDVEVDPEWLKEIRAATERWPQHSVFGGKIRPLWPSGDVPWWAKINYIQSLCFACHDYGDTEQLYPPNQRPFSPNLWVRREIFDGERRFDTAIGPRPGSYIMGSETSFLIRLEQDGYEIVYCPQAVVGHHVQPWQISIRNPLRRAFRGGRGYPRFYGLPRAGLFAKYPALWFVHRALATARSLCRLARGVCSLSAEKRLLRSMRALSSLGQNVEALKMAAAARRDASPRRTGPEPAARAE
jgi:glycosyltransferase involved in cell wall biosynthesis